MQMSTITSRGPRARNVGFLVTGITNGCELPDVVPRIQIQVLCKSKRCVLSAAEPSPQPLCFFFHVRIHL